MEIEEQISEIYENYEKTFQRAVAVAVEETRNQNPKIRVEIYMRRNGLVGVSETTTSKTARVPNTIHLLNVYGWEENLLGDKPEDLEDEFLDAKTKQEEVEDEIIQNDMIGILFGDR